MAHNLLRLFISEPLGEPSPLISMDKHSKNAPSSSSASQFTADAINAVISTKNYLSKTPFASLDNFQQIDTIGIVIRFQYFLLLFVKDLPIPSLDTQKRKSVLKKRNLDSRG
jgi:hypothetical protein